MLTLGEKLQTYKLKNCVVETFVAFSPRVASNVATFGKDYYNTLKIEGYFSLFTERDNEIRIFRHWPQIAPDFCRLISRLKWLCPCM